jgi:hypothetical protein
MAKADNLTIGELVNRIVDKEGARGKATETLAQLHERLESELEATNDPDKRKRLENDLEYLTGYEETPAALLADLHARRKRAIA